MQSKIIILGSNGYLGSNLYSFLKFKNYNVIGVSRKNSNCSDLILEDYYHKFYKLKNIIKQQDIVINCLNDVKINSKNLDFIKFFYDNTDVNIKLIQISSLSVYSTEQNIYLKENSLLNPKSKYGKIKFNIEKKIKYFNYFDKFIILRVGGIYGNGRIPKILKLKINPFFRVLLNLIFYNTSLKLISIYNLTKFIENIIKYDSFNNDTMNVFYDHKIIESKKNFISFFLKNTILRKYYLDIDNSKFKELNYE